jgi:hypothetical protein
MIKPSVFIGSSSEGLDFARAIRGRLDNDAEITLWEDNFFTLGSTFIETLVNSAPRFDFAILVLTADDLINSRDNESFGPRDNVIFELGLFMGTIGRARTFIVHQADTRLKIPTDLSGVTTAKYQWPRQDNSHESAVGTACDALRKVIRDLGFTERKTQKKLEVVQAEQLEQKENIEALSFVVSHFLPKYELEHLQKLNSKTPFPYDMSESFQREIRHLFEMHFTRKKKEFRLSKMPPKGDLQEYFEVTESGKYFLKLRQRFDNNASNAELDY